MDKSYFIPLYNQRLGTNTVFSFFLWGLLGKEGRLRVKGRLFEGGVTFGKRKRTSQGREEEWDLELPGRPLGTKRKK